MASTVATSALVSEAGNFDDPLRLCKVYTEGACDSELPNTPKSEAVEFPPGISRQTFQCFPVTLQWRSQMTDVTGGLGEPHQGQGHTGMKAL